MFCKYCGKEIGDNDAFCSGCGKSTSEPEIKEPIADPIEAVPSPAQDTAKKKKKRRGPMGCLIWTVVVFLCAIFIAIIFGGEEIPEEATPPASAQAGPATEATTEPTTVPEITVYKSGMYKVGSEIEPGEYLITHTKGNSAYMQVNSDSTGSFDSIVANENIATFHYISVIDGQYLTVKHGTFVKAEDAEIPKPDSDGNYGEGMYRVGIDIPAGEYKVTPRPGDDIYYEVNSDSTGDFLSIVANGHTSDPTYITVEDGQYFKLKDGTFALVK